MQTLSEYTRIVVRFMLDNMNGLLGELNLLYSYELILH